MKPSAASPIAGPDWLATVELPETAIICGSAPSLKAEFELARAEMPSATVIVVNEAGRIIHGSMLMTQHPEKALKFKGVSINPGIEVHTGKPKLRASQPGIDVYWPGGVTLATSGGSAIKIALRMGFSEIVLCGMPMSGGDGYFAQSALEQDEPRFGLENPESDYIQGYRKKLIEFTQKQSAARERVRSMSGFTRELFGPPEWL